LPSFPRKPTPPARNSLPRSTLAGLWEEVRLRHYFSLDLPHIKAAVDNEFSDWETPLKNYDTIAFMPPFAGG
jgi:molybdopterin converting factor small subunit